MEDFEFDRRFSTVWLPGLLSDAFGITKSEARRKIKEGAIKINGEKYMWSSCAVMDVDGQVLQLGKRKFVRCVLEEKA
jgi:tyrosyl-tRNA synthetase